MTSLNPHDPLFEMFSAVLDLIPPPMMKWKRMKGPLKGWKHDGACFVQ